MKEQRLQPRYVVPDTETSLIASLDTPRLHCPARVLDLSLSGAGLAIDSQYRPEGRFASFDLRLSHRLLGEMPVDLIHMQDGARQGTQLVGVRYRVPSEPFLQELCRYLVQTRSQKASAPRFATDLKPYSVSTDPRRLRQLMVHCCRRQRPLRLSEAAGKPAGSFHLQQLEKELLHGRTELFRGRTLKVGAPYLLSLCASTGLYVLNARCLTVDGERATFSMPEQLLHGGVRGSYRVQDLNRPPVYLDFLHPQIPGKLVHKRAVDYGPGGLRFDLNLDEDVLIAGTVIDSAALRLPDGQTLACRCIVRHTFEKLEGGHGCGVELQEFVGSGREVWVDKVLALMNPDVEEVTPATLEQAWGVFDRSGYLDEKPREQLEAMHQPFVQTWQKLLNNRQGARFWLHRGTSEPAGTISVTRIYSKTWLVHHLAVDKAAYATRKLLVLSRLLPASAFQWLGSAHPDGYLLAYFDADKSFNQEIWLSFLARTAAVGNQSTAAVRLLEYSTDLSSDMLPKHITCREPRSSEIKAIATDLMGRDGEVASDACDHVPGRIALPAARPKGSDEASVPERHLIVACRRRAMVGYAVVEYGAAALNIFLLYDICRPVLLLDAEDQDAKAVMSALVAAAALLYRARRRNTFLCMLDDSQPGIAPFHFGAKAIRAIISNALIPRWIAFLTETWGER